MIDNIIEYELQLEKAMLDSDVLALDILLADDLIFTTHLGQRITKEDDIEAHQSGTLTIQESKQTDQKIQMYSNLAIVSVHTYIVGNFAGHVTSDDFRFTRVWRETSVGWQVIAGHASMVV